MDDGLQRGQSEQVTDGQDPCMLLEESKVVRLVVLASPKPSINLQILLVEYKNILVYGLDTARAADFHRMTKN